MNNYSTINIKFIFIAILLGLALFAVIVFFMPIEAGIAPQTTHLFTYLVPAFTAFSVMAAWVVPAQRIRKIDRNAPLEDKLANWRTAFIFRLALLESPGFLNIIAYLLTKNTLFLYFFAVVFVLMSLQFPTVGKIASELNLNYNEQQKLE